MASRLQDVILRGLAADKPTASTVAPGTLYYSSDTSVTERSNGTAWESYSGSGGSGGGPHAPTHASGGSDPVTLAQSQITGLTTDLANKANAVHAANHTAIGSDPLPITSLAGFPGGTTSFLRADGSFGIPPSAPGITQLTGDVTAGPGSGSQPSTLSNTTVVPGIYTNTNLTVDAKGRITAAANGSSTRIGSITMMTDGAGAVLTTGVKGFLEIPFACTILAATLLADVVGSIVIDIWKDSYANYPPTVADSITASAKPTLSSALKSQDTTLTGWTTAIAAGDILGFNISSVATITRITLSLKFQA